MKNKKTKKRSFFRYLNGTLVSWLVLILIQLITSCLMCCIWHLLFTYGSFTEADAGRLYIFNYAISSIFVGSIVSIIAVHIPFSRMKRLINATKKIADGDFSVRLRKKITKGRLNNNLIDSFNHMAQQLQSTEMLSHDFINNFSHECKTPISSINGFAKILKNENLTKEERDEYIDIIIQESEKLSNLSRNILDLSKLENQAILTNKTDIDISEQIRMAIGAVYTKVAEKNVTVEFNAPEYFINGNKSMLESVWTNLLDNAIKFSPEGGTIRINITTDEDSIICLFSNGGTPISDEKQKRLFDRFYQADDSRSTGGYGLGLSITKRIVELHDGDIRLVKSDEKETVFEVRLPK